MALQRWSSRRAAILLASCAGFIACATLPVSAQSLPEALASAYNYSPQLNSARAQLRVVNENVPQALSGYRPRVTANADVGIAGTRTTSSVGGASSESTLYPRGASVQIDQTLFNGFATDNNVRQAESLVRAQRETLRTTEQDILLLAVTAYMDVVRDTAIVDLRRNNITVLQEQLRATQDRFNVGEVTRTDVAQAEAAVALARAQFEAARASLAVSRANYIRFIGQEPRRLNDAFNVERLLPRTLDQALAVGSNEHPQVRAATYNVDSASFAVNVQEAALLPTVTVTGTAASSFERSESVRRSDSVSLVGRVTVPIYQGGAEYSRVRQAKETLGQRRIDVDTVREQIRALVRGNWGSLEAARAQIVAAQAQISSNQIALNGVREEARVGQRTTLDVLNAQQTLLNSQVQLVQSQRDRVVTAFTVLGAIGRLNLAVLRVNAPQHDPQLHYNQVRDRWHGLRTPSGE